MSTHYLKVKVKSLAAEAAAIRLERRKLRAKIDHSKTVKHLWKWRGIRQGLRDHDISVVRPEARIACLAYGFLRGRSYAEMEAKCYLRPDFEKVWRLVKKYGDRSQDEFEAWRPNWSSNNRGQYLPQSFNYTGGSGGGTSAASSNAGNTSGCVAAG